MKFPHLIGVTVATLLLSGTTLAQSYPSKPIRLLVPFGPGGVGDITSRAVMQKMSEAIGQQIIIDNRPSAGAACCKYRIEAMSASASPHITSAPLFTTDR